MLNGMGYNMSKPELDPSMCTRSTDDGASSRQKHQRSFDIDHDIFHLTRLRSEPSESTLTGMYVGRKAPISTVKMLAGREVNCSGRGRFSSADSTHVLGRYLPVKGPWPVDQMDTRAYVSQFSSDGSLFIAGFQGSHIRIYDVDNGWKVQKDILARSLRWTITDTSLSPDQRFLVYASMSPIVHIVNVGSAVRESYANVTDIHDGLDFSVHEEGVFSFGIFSVKFSTDGRELVAGTSDDSIYVFDLEANKLTSRIPAHMYDVNTVTFADETGNIIYSGSDDNLCKVWDRRCFISKGKAAGVLTGHLEGITFIDSRGDGRHFISNGKDQTTKLWDIRKISSSPKSFRSPISGWDYRSMEYPPEAKQIKHPCDQSLATYRGHSVLRTLIRCYFSPAYSTGQRYIYTGSHDNCVYIYDVVTGAQVACLDGHDSTVRDCSWHPYYPMFVSSSWDGMIARWEFSGNDAVPVLTRRSWGGIDDRMFRAIYL
ncbi:LEC14B protein-like isoform X1 [Iris pallida]|uniref:LEC14B homolog n=1 Tax=Iris pallida TaxID=29817 RepID=A0AAX6FFB0_IRIPA|nr:LEC14B protein-like isoform X1 [Iris pallida]KAJ6815072.1 LEC14B protein-like isoform X1 [Iris pallida]